VYGDVVKPSEVSIKGRLTVTQAIEAAGGIAGGKKGKEVKVHSMMADTREGRTIYVDLKAIEKRPYKDFELQSFDIVVVYSPKKAKTDTQPASNPCHSMLPESLWRGYHL
jgi:protein involved in polysaccharide export with SLBB domain